jgi:hypothetical protein
MEVRVNAIPAGSFHIHTPRRKSGTVLFRPDISTGVRRGQRLIFPASVCVTHALSSLSEVLSAFRIL